ncbi:MAG: DsbA family protein, partial [Protaetiibacter sp.]
AAALFRGYAERLGLDLAAYDTAVADAGTRAAVDADAEAGAALGVNSTPTFYLDGKRLELTRYTDLADAVEAALADAR